jgi:hypothetical protein
MQEWIPARGSGHPLQALDGMPLEETTIEVMLGPKNRYGALYFKALILATTGDISQPVLLALYNSGPYPGFNWIEVIMLKRDVTSYA